MERQTERDAIGRLSHDAAGMLSRWTELDEPVGVAGRRDGRLLGRPDGAEPGR